jgi:ferric-dicitrate binding protein FerR (iron transport regulator)
MIGNFTDSTVMAVNEDESGVYTDWETQRIVFHDVPVPTVLAMLRRWYGYEFRLSDPVIATKRVTAEVPVGKTDAMMTAMKHILDVRMEFRDSVVTIRPNRANELRRPKLRRAVEDSFISATEVGR